MEIPKITAEELSAGIGEIGDTRLNDEWAFIDGDTLSSRDGKRVRLRGLSAPETMKMSDYTKEYQQAGNEAHIQYAKVARENGFTDPILEDNKDDYGRTLGDIANPNTGQLFSDFMSKQGMTPLTAYSDNAQVTSDVDRNSIILFGSKEAQEEVQLLDEEKMAIFEANGGEQEFKTLAFNEKYFDKDLHAGVMLRRMDRTLDNKALHQFSTSWDYAMQGMSESWSGMKQMLGDATGLEGLELRGQIDVANKRREMGELPTVNVDLGNVEGIGDFAEYLGNTATMSIPYMANTLASGLVGGAVGTAIGGPVGAVTGAVVGLSSPTAVYAGQVYNSQDEKNAGAALMSGLAQGVLDRVGLKSVTGLASLGTLGGKQQFKGVMRQAEKDLITKGMSKEQARLTIGNATKKEVRGYLDDALATSKQQLSARNITRNIFRHMSKGMGVEAATEVVQESLAHAGENWNQDDFGFFDFDGLNNELVGRLQNAAVAGGALGGAFGAVGGVREAGIESDFAWELAALDPTLEDQLYSKEVDPKTGKSKSIQMRYAEMSRGAEDSTDLAFRMSSHTQTQAEKKLTEKALEAAVSAPVLWQGMMRSRILKEDLLKSSAWRQLSASYGGTLGRIMPGKVFEEDTHSTKQRYLNGLAKSDAKPGEDTGGFSPKFYTQNYKGIKNDARAAEEWNKKKKEVDRDYNKWIDDNYDKNLGRTRNGAVYDWSKWDGDNTSNYEAMLQREPGMNMWQQITEDSEAMADKMRQRQNYWWGANHKLGSKPMGIKFKKLNNYFGKFRAMRRNEIESDRGTFETLLQQEYGFSADDATQLTTRILEPESLDGHDDNVFDLIAKGVPATASKERTIGLSQNPKFDKYFHSDFFHNFSEGARMAARFETFHKYVGRDNWRVAQLLDTAASEGVPQERVNAMAGHINNYLEAQSGNYKRPAKGSAGERAMGIQKAVLTYSVVTSLTMSALSSLVELSLGPMGLKNDQIFGRNKGLNGMGHHLAMMFGRGASRIGQELWTGREYMSKDKGMGMMHRLGLTSSWSTGAATTVGATETSERAKGFIEKYFKYNGLEGLTNTQRMIRDTSYMDVMNQWMVDMDTFEPSEKGHAYAARQMRDLGVDPVRYSELTKKWEKDYLAEQEGRPPMMTEAESYEYRDMVDLSRYNYANQAVALPGTSNRPLFYQDPRLAMFTQFNGYIATFTANHLPRMWRDYIKNGPPSIKYNTFALMMTMLLLAFASQYLKDWAKYGEDGSPWLDDAQKIRRAVNSSGLLGQGERVSNFIWPTFDRSSSSFMGGAAETIMGEAPAMSPIERMYKGVGALVEGDTENAAYNVMRGSPIIGPLTSLAETLSGQKNRP